MVEFNKDEQANAHNELKCFCKEFSFTTWIFKRVLAEGEKSDN